MSDYYFKFKITYGLSSCQVTLKLSLDLITMPIVAKILKEKHKNTYVIGIRTGGAGGAIALSLFT